MANLDQFKHDHLAEQGRGEAVRGRQSLGPIVEAVAMLRGCCGTIRLLLDQLESSVGDHLELLDALLHERDGSRWWDQQQRDAGGDF